MPSLNKSDAFGPSLYKTVPIDQNEPGIQFRSCLAKRMRFTKNGRFFIVRSGDLEVLSASPRKGFKDCHQLFGRLRANRYRQNRKSLARNARQSFPPPKRVLPTISPHQPLWRNLSQIRRTADLEDGFAVAPKGQPPWTGAVKRKIRFFRCIPPTVPCIRPTFGCIPSTLPCFGRNGRKTRDTLLANYDRAVRSVARRR